MERTRLLGFLGMGKYQRTKYVWQGKEAESEFTPCAIADILADTNGRPDEVYIVCTKEAWQANGANLQGQLSKIGVAASEKNIPYGESEKQLWEIFNLLVQLCKWEGRVIIDITHGFRSQPFFAASVLTFIRTTVQASPDITVLYGAFDAKRGDAAPIWDLTQFIEVVDWAMALHMFLKTGRSEQIGQLTDRYGRRLGTEWAQDRTGERPKLQNVARRLKEFGDDLATLRTGNIIGPHGSADRLSKVLEEAEHQIRDVLPPLREVLESLKQRANRLSCIDLKSDSGPKALAELAQLYLEMERYLEAATVVREGWISAFAGEDARKPGPGFREDSRRSSERKCKQKLGDIYNEFGDLRNDLAHAGMKANPRDPKTIIGGVKREVERLLNEKFPLTILESVSSGPGVFLNISNHPSKDWDEAQRRAAMQMVGEGGQIVDISFPLVDPTKVDLQYLFRAADEVMGQVPQSATHAMVQGEHVLSTILVARLQARGARCFAATTERDVQIAPDGSKVSRFAFRGFREYPLIREESAHRDATSC